jgi:hypothetical protein
LLNLPKLDPQHVAGLLHIALNCDREDLACELLAWLLCDPDSLPDERELLADTWQHHALAMQQLQQHVNRPDGLYEMLRTAIKRGHCKAVALLCQMPAVSQIKLDAAAKLVAAPLGSHKVLPFVQLLIRQLPAAQLIPVSGLEDIFV